MAAAAQAVAAADAAQASAARATLVALVAFSQAGLQVSGTGVTIQHNQRVHSDDPGTHCAVLPPCWRCCLQIIAQHADVPAHIAMLTLQLTSSQLAGGGVAAQAAGPGALLLQPAQPAPPRTAGWQVDELAASGRKLRFPGCWSGPLPSTCLLEMAPRHWEACAF